MGRHKNRFNNNQPNSIQPLDHIGREPSYFDIQPRAYALHEQKGGTELENCWKRKGSVRRQGMLLVERNLLNTCVILVAGFCLLQGCREQKATSDPKTQFSNFVNEGSSHQEEAPVNTWVNVAF